MSETVIRVENLSKKYVLSHQQEGRSYKALRDVIADGTKSLFSSFQNGKSKLENPTREEFWALKDVSFEIKQGDRVGIIGRNGAGKSTLLKILSRIVEPTHGSIKIKGRVASLLEVGTGFHPELTGRENIFLNGAILGMSKTEIQRKFDEIVSFAEVEKFLDTPVKRYSSGMYVRLAFAVAAHLDPQVLIVDEVLAVGDTQFQKKCLGRMNEVAKEGRTIIFVSHNMAAINNFCSTALVLKKGKIVQQGMPSHCIQKYADDNLQEKSDVWVRESQAKDKGLALAKVTSELHGIQPHHTLKLIVFLKSLYKHNPAHVAIDIADINGTPIMQAIPSFQNYIEYQKEEHIVHVSIVLPPLIPGRYLVSVWVGNHHTNTFDWAREIIMFEINSSPTPGRTFPHTPDHGYIVPVSEVNCLKYLS